MSWYDFSMSKVKKREVTNEAVLKAVVALNVRVDGLVTKEDIEYIKKNMATEKHIEAIKDEFEYLGEEVDALKKSAATKDEVQSIVDGAKEEILEVVEPIEKAVDKDAPTSVDHERRLVRVESRLSLSK